MEFFHHVNEVCKISRTYISTRQRKGARRYVYSHVCSGPYCACILETLTPANPSNLVHFGFMVYNIRYLKINTVLENYPSSRLPLKFYYTVHAQTKRNEVNIRHRFTRNTSLEPWLHAVHYEDDGSTTQTHFSIFTTLKF